jgi:hypothetical protein
VPTAPAQVLTPRPSTHIRDGLALVAAGVGGYGAATLTGHPGWDLPALGAGLAGGLAVAVKGHRTKQRRALHDRLVEALAPWLGVRQLDRRIVRLRRWTNGWPGLPRRVTVRYAPGAPDGDPQWKSNILTAVTSRLLAKYEVDQHDQLRCRLDLRLVTIPDDEAAKPPYAQVRAERAITELIGPTASVAGVELDGDQLRSITVTHQAGAKLAARGYRARIERVISTMMPGRWRAVWDLEGDSVRFETRPLLPSSVWLPTDKPADTEDLLHNYRDVKIPYAVDEDDKEMVWYPARSPMFMITGGTGSGKTSSGHALLGKITQYGWPVWVGDAKRVEFLDFRDWPNVQIVAGSIPQQVALIRAAWSLMEDRYKLIEQGRATVNDFEPLVVFLDEFAEFRSNLLEWYAQIKVKGDPTRPPTQSEVASLARKARTARIHLVLSTQRPDAEFLGGEALALDTPVPTPHGWTTMGEIRPGDTVYDHTGAPTVVTTATAVAYGRPCYRVTFSDGSTFVTDANHRWLAHSASRRASLGSTYVPLTRAERWPHHLTLTEQLRDLDLDDTSEVTVSEFEAALGPGRNALLRRLLASGRTHLAAVGVRPGRSGRFVARTYLVGGLKEVLTSEVAAAPRTGRPTGGEIVTTEQMAWSLTTSRGATNWSIDVSSPIQAPSADLPIDPWLLGYWLGDGYKANATIATNDDEVLDRIRDLGYRVTHYGRFNYGISTGPRGGRLARSTLVGELRALGLLNNKHIPATYLRASIAQREALLAGLLDSDGTCAIRGHKQTSGQVVFTNVNRALTEGVAELVASLGFIPTIRQVRPAGFENHPSSVAYGRPTSAAFAVSFTPDRQVFSLATKRAVLKPSLTAPRRPTTSRRYVVNIEPVESVPVRCIAVAAREHLYLAGKRFIPTHNTRDNFGQRMSMGRLSPQGAMMMWENPAVGVSLPRACTGRATATHEDGRPAEVQAYRFPDMRSPEGSEERAILDAIRPQTSRHPRLIIVPPEDAAERDLETGEAISPTFRDYANASWVLASDRPDLDPLAVDRSSTTVGGRALSSTLASLGIADAHVHPTERQHREPTFAAVDEALDPTDQGSSWMDAPVVDEYAGYAPETTTHPLHLIPGDLIRLDPDEDTWVVVDEEPVEDYAEPGCAAISWRGDGDESGALSVSDDTLIAVRRPEELGS